MSVIMVWECRIKPDVLEETKQFLKDEMHNTRAFPGCEGVTSCDNTADRHSLLFLVRWNQPADLDAYRAFRREKGDAGKLQALLESSSLRVFSPIGI